MGKKTMFLMLTLMILGAASGNAQVTIGSTDDPHAGAVLDLSKASGNSVGFLLSRVSLENVNTWQIGGTSTDGNGMMVYNTNDNVVGGDGSGIYVWNGNAWTPIMSGVNDVCPRVVKDSENNTYLTGWFDAAGCWMTRNLRSTKYADGTLLNEWKEDISNEKCYIYPNLDTSSPAEYGLLYTWQAASERSGATSRYYEENEENLPTQAQYQGICPSGWHLPSDYEWNRLEEVIAKSAVDEFSTSGATLWDASYNICPNPNTNISSTRGTHGKKMKSLTAVNGQDTGGTSKTCRTNGFDALLVGGYFGGFEHYSGDRALFWTSSKRQEWDHAWSRDFSHTTPAVSKSSAGMIFHGCSVRCKKNDN
jgi:uncharacterized protein (TIGR02145 family)